MRTTCIALALACLAPSGASAQASEAPLPDATIVARAAASGLTAGELRREVLALRRVGGAGAIVATATVDGLERVARDLMDRRLLAGAARARGLETDPAVAPLLTRATEIVLADALATRVSSAVDTSDSSARAFHRAHADRFRTGARRRARHLVVASREQADAALQEVRAGRDFAELASSLNVDVTRKSGGDLGWVPPGLMVRAFDEVLFGLGAGEVGGPVQTTMGWHLVKVEEIDPGTLPAFELVRDRVIETMRLDAREALLHTLRAESPVLVDRDRLSELLK